MFYSGAVTNSTSELATTGGSGGGVGTHHVGRGASPLEKEEQTPRCGGRKSARAWLGRTKKKAFCGGRSESRRKSVAAACQVREKGPVPFPGYDLSASSSPWDSPLRARGCWAPSCSRQSSLTSSSSLSLSLPPPPPRRK